MGHNGQVKHPRPPQLNHRESHSSVHLQPEAGQMKWLTEAWVGRIKKLQHFERIEDDLPWELGVDVVPKYIGDDMILLLGLSDAKAEEIITAETQHGTSPFRSLERWNPTLRPGYRLAWAQCWGIPLEVWDMENIRKIVAAIGDLVEVDDDVEEKRRMDRARIVIRTPWKPLFNHTVSVTIGDATHRVYIVEEGASDIGVRNLLGRRTFESSEELDSDDAEGVSDDDSYLPPYELLRRKPKNPKVVVNSNGGARPVNGSYGGRSADPTATNQSGDILGDPMTSAQSQGNTSLWKTSTSDEEQPPVVASKPRPPLPKGPSPTQNTAVIAQGSWVKSPNFENGEHLMPETATEQENDGKGPVTGITEGEICVGETQKRKEQGEGLSLTATTAPPDDMQEERAVMNPQIQMKDVSEILKGPPHSLLTHQNTDIESTDKVGQSQHFISSPTYKATDKEPLTPPIGTRDFKKYEGGSLNGLDLTKCTATNNFQQNTSGPSYQSAEGKTEWKVFVRRKGCKKQVAKDEPNKRKVSKPLFSEYNSLTESTERATLKQSIKATSTLLEPVDGQYEEASFQWEIAKLLGVTTDSEQAAIIHKFKDMETRDKIEAEELGGNIPPS